MANTNNAENSSPLSSTNILILGKSGIGKSTLLNYLWGDALAATGTGRPCTGEGLFAYPPVTHGNVVMTIYDSYGLEANKASRWHKLIQEEVRKHDDSLNIHDWFHTVVYCVNAAGARIEPFEIEHVIKPLQASGNRVCFVLTKCDIATEQEIAALEHIIHAEVRDHGGVIRVCSERNEKRNGVVTLPYGKEKLFQACSRNLALNLAGKIGPNYELLIQARVVTIREKVIARFRKNARVPNPLSGIKALYFMTGPAIPHLMNHKPSNYKWAFEKASETAVRAYKNLDKEGMAWVINACEQCLLLSYRADASLYNALPAHELPKIHSITTADKVLLLEQYSQGVDVLLSLIPLINLLYDKTADEFWEDELLKGLVEIEEKVINEHREVGQLMARALQELLLRNQQEAER